MSVRTTQVRVEHVGREAAPVLVVDWPLSDPKPLLEAAYAAQYGPPAVKAFPGVRAPAPRAYAHALVDALLPTLRDVFDLPGQIASWTSNFSLVTRPPDALELRQRIPHTDTSDPRLIALLHYLAPQGCSGTSFYRHRSTGFESVTPERRSPYEAALAGDLQRQPPRGYFGGDSPLFVRTSGFDGAFNRLIAYRGALLHSGDVPSDFAFSTDPRQGRLTANTFFVMGTG